jgi:hypothetical protein
VTAGQVIFAPLLPWPLVWAAAALMALVLGLAIWRGLAGWWLRALAAASLIGALANPSLQREDRDPLSDIVLAVVDGSASQGISDRPAQVAQALADTEAAVAALPNTELRVIHVGDAEGDGGTLLMTALAEAMAEEPRAGPAGRKISARPPPALRVRAGLAPSGPAVRRVRAARWQSPPRRLPEPPERTDVRPRSRPETRKTAFPAKPSGNRIRSP